MAVGAAAVFEDAYCEVEATSKEMIMAYFTAFF
jgi:hypothetical protein